MYLAAIAPITAIPRPNPQILTYFTSKKLAAGCLVMVPLFKRQTPGLVLKIKSLRQAKSLVKQTSYGMRPISYVINSQAILPPAQIQLALWTSQYYFAPLGRVLKSFLPDIKKLANINFGLASSPIDRRQPTTRNPQPANLSSDTASQNEIIIQTIKHALDTNQQTILLVPEIHQIKKWQIDIEKEFNQTPVIFHSRLTPKQYFLNWLMVRNNEAKIILGTRQAILAPAQNLGLIIINDEHSPFYKSYDQKPYLNSRDVALKLAELIDAKIILASATPSIETHQNSTSPIVQPATCNSQPPTQVIDLRREIKAGNYLLLSRALQQKISDLLSQKKQILLFINRKGTASALLCHDCGQTINCPNCSVPLITHQNYRPGVMALTRDPSTTKVEIPETRNHTSISQLACHHCNYQQPAPTACPHCSSHWLKTIGSGTQKLLAQTQQLFPQAKIAILDKTIAPKPQDEQKILTAWQDNQIDILVSTALIFNLAPDFTADFISIVNIDRQLNLPDFHAAERAWQTLKRLQRLLCRSELVGRHAEFISRHSEFISGSSINAVDSGSEPGMTTFLIQSYNPKNYAIQAIAQNNDQLFYRQEIKNRAHFFYPPFSHLVKLTIKHKNNTFAKEQAQILKAKLDRAIIKVPDKIKILGPAPGFIPKIKNQYIWQIILKTDPKIMPKLPILLGIIPKFWLIDIDPENLLS